MKTNIIFNGWFPLAIAIIFGVLGTISLKLSHGLSKLKPTLFIGIFYTICFVALTFAIKYLELSVVYAVWSGIGTVIIAMIGVIYFHESLSIKKIFFLALILIGIIGIHQ